MTDFSQGILTGSLFIAFTFLILNMGSIPKSFALVLILLVALSSLTLITVKPTDAQTIAKPSVPQFTIKFVPSSENNTIQLTIKNQPIPSAIVSNGPIFLYYNVKTKGQYSSEWTSEYSSPFWAPSQSSSQYTVFSFPADYKSNDQIDFQVEAIFGMQYSYDAYFYGGYHHIVPQHRNDFVYNYSDWSPTQTITIPNTSTTTPLNQVIIGVFLAITILVIAVSLLLYRRHRNATERR